MQLVFMVEERSMQQFLDGILHRILPDGVDFCIIPHNGKQDLQASIPRKIRAWNVPDSRFVIVHDQDANDCMILKNRLVELCSVKPVLFKVRIVCHELEAWYFGGVGAVEQAYGVDLSRVKRKAKYRNPDSIVCPKAEIKKLVPQIEQIDGAMKISEYFNADDNTSRSFNVFKDGILELCKVQDEQGNCSICTG